MTPPAPKPASSRSPGSKSAGSKSLVGRRGPRPAVERLRSLLVMLPWLMERGEASLADMTARFQLSEADVVRDLELAAMCGLPPFIDEMIDVFIDDGTVYAGVPRVFTRPLRLTAPEGFALLASVRSALTLPGADADGALARALAKLEATLGAGALVVDAAPPDGTDDLVAAAAAGERLEIRYWSAGRDEIGERQVTPRAVFTDRGRWYLLADDDRSGQERTFRIDRIERWVRTGVFDPARRVHVPTGSEWFTDGDVALVTLDLEPGARWVAERYPTHDVSDRTGAATGGLRVVLPVTNEGWLAELLVRLGRHAKVVAPEQWRDLGRTAAEALLARYSSDVS